MTSGFKFGFQTDDIDIDVDEDMSDAGDAHAHVQQDEVESQGRSTAPFETKSHSIEELLSTFPSQIFYNTLTFNSADGGRQISVPRREVFDANAQLMAEDSDFEKTADGDLASQLKHSDVRAGMFEGGSKTWECSLDLAGVVVGDYEFLMTEDVEEVRIIEHGSGPAIPALALLKTIFRTPKPSHPPRRKTHFVLSDYNLIFLRLLTVPNVLLTWYVTRHHPDADADTDPESESELDITEPLLADFRADLEAYGLSFTFISGPWSQTWTDMAFPVPKEEGEKQQQQPVVGKGYTLLFSSETIYETRTYPEFVGSIVTILDRAAERHHHGIGGSSPDVRYKHPKALVAAKKMYFGVGGGIDDFVPFLNGVAGDRTSVGERLDVSDQGVSRGVWEVELTGRRND